VDALLAAVEVAHFDLAEVVLRELTRHALEAHQRARGLRPQLAHQLIERALAAAVALPAQPVQDLHGRQPRLSREHGHHALPKGCRHAGSSHAPLARLRHVARVLDRRLAADRPYAALRDSLDCRDSRLRQPGGPQHLHSMSCHGSDHPPWPPDDAVHPRAFGWPRYRNPAGSTGRSFRNQLGRNFRNPHRQVGKQRLGQRARLRMGYSAGCRWGSACPDSD
jgi:hypothetical protein